ncbi:MAG: glycerophosphodiester phosphodiesterase family protein [Cyclobacteriaceae bacterium]
MKALVSSFILYLFIFTIGYPQEVVFSDRASQLRSQLLDRANARVFVVAHRADWRNAPENSLEAIENAIEMGVDMIEIDVRKTSDGELVVMHDQTIDRTTSGQGKVSDYTLDSLKTLYLRNGQGRVTRFKIPTLEEALLAAKGQVLVNLDKSYNYFDQVYALLKETGTAEQVVMKAKKPLALVEKEFGEYLNEVIFMPIVDLEDPHAEAWINEYLQNQSTIAFELVFRKDSYLTPTIINRLNHANARIWINSLWDSLNGGHSDDLALSDPDAAYGWILDQGATIIQTDRPQLLIEYLQTSNLSK